MPRFHCAYQLFSDLQKELVFWRSHANTSNSTHYFVVYFATHRLVPFALTVVAHLEYMADRLVI